MRLGLGLGLSHGAAGGGGPPPLSGLTAEFYDDFEVDGTLQVRTGWDGYTPGFKTSAKTWLRATGGNLLGRTFEGTGVDYAYHNVGSSTTGQFIEIDVDFSVTTARAYILNGDDGANSVRFSLTGGSGMSIIKRVGGADDPTNLAPPYTVPAGDVAKYRFELLRTGELRVWRNKIRVGDHTGPNGNGFAAKNLGSLITNGNKAGMPCIANDTAIIAKDFRCGILPLTCDTSQIFYAADPVTGLAPVTVSGIYEGTSTGMDYEVRKLTDDSVVQSRTAYSPRTTGSGSYTGTASVPRGVNRLHTDFTNDDTAANYSNHFSVGDCFASWGQSENAGLGNLNTIGNYSNNRFVNYFRIFGSLWRQDNGTTGWVSCGAETTKVISDLTGLPYGIVDNGVAAESSTNLKPTGVHWPTFTSSLATATGNRIKGFSWYQGPGNMILESGANLWLPDTNDIIAEVRTITGNATLPIFIGGTGYPIPGSAENDRAANIVRDAQQGLHNPAGNVYFAWHGLGVAIIGAPDYHPSVAGSIEISRRRGLTIAKWLYGGAYDGRGPLTGTPTRSGATITIPIDLNGATSLSGTSLSGFVVGTTAASLENATSPLTITSVNVSGSNIVIVLAADPGAPVWVASHRGRAWAETSLAIGTYADATTIPVCPMRPIQTTT